MEVDPSTLKSVINNAHRILIIPNTKGNLDIVFAALALAQELAINKKDAQLLSPLLVRNKIWRAKLDESIKGMLVARPQSQMSINVIGNDLEIADVKLVKEDSGYKIILNGINSINTPNLNTSISETASTYDLCIVIGTPTLNLPLQSYSKQILYITNQISTIATKDSNTIYYKGLSKSYSSKVDDMFHVIKTNESPKSLTFLLSGMIAYSNVYTRNVTEDTFRSLAEMVKKGGDYHQAYDLAVNSLTLDKVKAIGQGLSKTTVFAEGIYGCFYPANELGNIQLRQKDLFKFSEIYNCRIAFVFIEHSPLNKIYLKTSAKDIHLKRLLKAYQGKGSNYDGMILTNESQDVFYDKLSQYLKDIN